VVQANPTHNVKMLADSCKFKGKRMEKGLGANTCGAWRPKVFQIIRVTHERACNQSSAASSSHADLVSKSGALRVMVGGKPVHIGGMCKGSGMIHPNMATMLGVVTCDALVTPEAWRGMVKRASIASFNQITVRAFKVLKFVLVSVSV